jgi:hypothetical protein
LTVSLSSFVLSQRAEASMTGGDSELESDLTGTNRIGLDFGHLETIMLVQLTDCSRPSGLLQQIPVFFSPFLWVGKREKNTIWLHPRVIDDGDSVGEWNRAIPRLLLDTVLHDAVYTGKKGGLYTPTFLTYSLLVLSFYYTGD